MWGKIIIPMYRLWLNGLYGLYGPRCPLFSKRPINLISLPLSFRWRNALVHHLNMPSLVQIMPCCLFWSMPNNGDLLSIGLSGTNFTEITIINQTFACMKMNLNIYQLQNGASQCVNKKLILINSNIKMDHTSLWYTNHGNWNKFK